eukprot:TRINITY_DN4262_c0_g1_i1.p1 TRINITY_DN4262_c0_g1~~TRINITY_DN4262_c0_g1_i1.p1  ORF type:complete len:936 (-),score=441.56 TRINITY_DN4262_c0_g1_i1:53-2860(-)
MNSSRFQSYLSPKTPKGDIIARDLYDEFSPVGNGNSFLNQSGNLLNGFQSPDAHFLTNPLPFSPSSGGLSPFISVSPLSDRNHRERLNGNDVKNSSISMENSNFLFKDFDGEDRKERKMNGKDHHSPSREENGKVEEIDHSRTNSLRDMQKIIDYQQHKIFDLKMQLYHWEERLKNISNGTKFSDKQLQDILEKDVEYKVEIEKFSKLLGASKDAIARLTLENDNLKRKIASNSPVQDTSGLRNQIDELMEGREKLLESLRRSEEENAELKRKMRETPSKSVSTGVLAEVQRENNDLHIQINELRDQLARRESSTNRTIEENRESKKSWETREKELKRMISEKDEKNEDLTKLLDETHLVLDRMDEEKKQMEGELKTLELKSNRNEEELERTRKREEKLREQIKMDADSTKNNEEVQRLNVELREKEERNRFLLKHQEEIQSEYKKIQIELKQAHETWKNQLDQKNQMISNLTSERDRFQRDFNEQSDHSFKLRTQLDKKIKETSVELAESVEKSNLLLSNLDLKINQLFSSSSHLRSQASEEEQELFAKKALNFFVSSPSRSSSQRNTNSSFFEEENETTEDIVKRITEKLTVFTRLSSSLSSESKENEQKFRNQLSESTKKLHQKEEELSHLRDELEKLNGLKENLLRDNNRLKNQITEIQSRSEDNESVERRIQNERKKLETELKNSTQKTNELMLKYQERDAENTNLKEKISRLERKLIDVRVEHNEKISELESNFSNETEKMIDKAMSEKNEKLNQLKEAKKKISEENKELLREKRSLEERLERVGQQRPLSASSSEDENRNKSGGIYNKEWMAQLSVAKERIARLSENNRILIMELEEKRQIQQDIAKKYQQLSRENKELKLEISRIKQESIHRLREGYNVDLSHEVLRQVEGTQQMMKKTDEQLEKEKEKYQRWMERTNYSTNSSRRY